jgi:hypothetical protein
MLVLILVLTITFPVLWLVSEFQERKWLRIVLGCAAISMSFLVAAGVGMLERLNFNAWYGYASQQLIETTLQELKADNKSGVEKNLAWLHARYHPTYENRANYDDLVAEYVSRFEQTNK